MHPCNLIGLKWMEGIGDGTTDWTDAFETEKKYCVDRSLPMAMTIEMITFVIVR